MGKLLEEVQFDSMSNIFDVGTDLDNILTEVAKDLTDAVYEIKDVAGDNMKMTAFVTGEAEDWVNGNFREQLEEYEKTKLGSEKWSPLTNALYRSARELAPPFCPFWSRAQP